MRNNNDYRKILELWEQSYNKFQISQMLNIPRSTIRDVILRYDSLAEFEKSLAEATIKTTQDWKNRLADPVFRENYAYLLGAYLGDGHIAKEPRTYKFRLFQDTQYPNIIQGYVDTLATVMPHNKVSLYYHKKDKCVDIICLSNS